MYSLDPVELDYDGQCKKRIFVRQGICSGLVAVCIQIGVDWNDLKYDHITIIQLSLSYLSYTLYISYGT